VQSATAPLPPGAASVVPILHSERQQDYPPGSSSDQLLDGLRTTCTTLLQQHSGLVLKPTHSCRSRGVVLMPPGRDATAMHDGGRQSSGSLSEIELPRALVTQEDLPAESAPMALAEVPAGAMIQPYVNHDIEVRVVCIWGVPVTAIATDGTSGLGCDYLYDPLLHIDPLTALQERLGPLWGRIAEAAAAVSQGSDFLRVDFFVEMATGTLLINEVDYIYQFVTARGWHGWIGAERIAQIWADAWLTAQALGAPLATLPEVSAELAAAPACPPAMLVLPEGTRVFLRGSGRPGTVKRLLSSERCVVTLDDEPDQELELSNAEIDLQPTMAIEGPAVSCTSGANVKTHTLLVDGGAVAMDELGPLVVGVDGSLSRITNWTDMIDAEQEAALRVLKRRNAARLKVLRAEHSGE